MQTPSAHGTRPRLAVNIAKVHELRRASGDISESELARRIGVNPATLYRVMTGRTAPSNEFIAGLKSVFPLCSLDDLLVLRTAA